MAGQLPQPPTTSDQQQAQAQAAIARAVWETTCQVYVQTVAAAISNTAGTDYRAIARESLEASKSLYSVLGAVKTDETGKHKA